MPIWCQESCIYYYLIHFPKQSCQLVIIVPVLQMEKSQQEVIDLPKVSGRVGSGSRTHNPGYLSGA